SGRLLVLHQPALVDGWVKWATDFSSTRSAAVLAVQSGNAGFVSEALSGTGCKVVELTAPDLLEYGSIDDISLNKEKIGKLLERGWCFAPSAGGQKSGAEASRAPDLLYEILIKDVLLATEVRDIAKLIDISLYLLESTGATFSYSEMRQHGMGSIDKIRSFVGAVERAGLVSVVERLEDAGRDRNQARRTCFAFDTGFAAALSRKELSECQLFRTALYWSLRRRSRHVRIIHSRWGEGFLLWDHGGRIAVFDAVENPGRCRGKAFVRYLGAIGAARAIVLCSEDLDGVEREDCTVTFEDPWRWIQKPDIGSGYEGTENTAGRDATASRGEGEGDEPLPVHLL
ncbi:MAG: hypothetical protein D6806_09685, partial [Deltaproteobacteria bacterium]